MEADVGIFSKRRGRNSRSGRSPLFRWLGPGATTAGLLYAVYMMIGGGWSFSALDGLLGTDPLAEFRGEPVVLSPGEQRPADRLRVATFNIRQFGATKSSTRENEMGVDVLGTIAQIISMFDLVAIQEIQSADGIAIRRLVDLLNQSGGNYAATMSDLIGNKHRTEAYAFVYDQSRVEYIENSSYVVIDDSDRMYREPMVASFQARLPANAQATLVNQAVGQSSPSMSGARPFRFTMINVHTKPDRVDPAVPDSEINVLADVFQSVREYEYSRAREDDFILLGDLNVSDANLGELRTIPGVISIAGDIHTNVGRDKTYDHIVIDRQYTSEYAQKAGVIDLQTHFGLTKEAAGKISDHIPLWAEFSIYEQQPAPTVQSQSTATGPRTTVIQ